jgi:hypothetical protein
MNSTCTRCMRANKVFHSSSSSSSSMTAAARKPRPIALPAVRLPESVATASPTPAYRPAPRRPAPNKSGCKATGEVEASDTVWPNPPAKPPRSSSSTQSDSSLFSGFLGCAKTSRSFGRSVPWLEERVCAVAVPVRAGDTKAEAVLWAVKMVDERGVRE